MEVVTMMGNRTQCTSAMFVVVTTLYAAPLWADHEHHASLAAIQTSTHETLRDAWLNQEKEEPFFTQSGRQSFGSGESDGLSFEHGGMAGDGQRTRTGIQTSQGTDVDIRPGGISTPDLGAGGIPMWKW